jgi:hypothetical protein
MWMEMGIVELMGRLVMEIVYFKYEMGYLPVL